MLTLRVFRKGDGILLKEKIWKKTEKLFANRYVNRLIRDSRLRTVMLTLPGMGLNLIYAVATYTFIKMGIAIKNMIQVRKEKSYLMMTLRNISYSDALVTMLSLQTALFAAFGEGQEKLIRRMDAMTGTAVCLMILSLGIYTLYDTKKK